MFYSVVICLAVISVAAADVAHLGYNYPPPTKHSGYNYDAPAQGAPTELHSEYVSAEYQPAAATHHNHVQAVHSVAPQHSSVKTGKIAARYESAAPVHVQKVKPQTHETKSASTHFQGSFETAPAATHLHAVHEAAPAAKHHHESYETAPAATHVHAVHQAAPVSKHHHESYETAPAATHVHAVHHAAPADKHFQESFETAPAASNQKPVLTSYDAPNFIDTNSLSVEATNDVGTVYGTNGGYVY